MPNQLYIIRPVGHDWHMATVKLRDSGFKNTEPTVREATRQFNKDKLKKALMEYLDAESLEFLEEPDFNVNNPFSSFSVSALRDGEWEEFEIEFSPTFIYGE